MSTIAPAKLLHTAVESTLDVLNRAHVLLKFSRAESLDVLHSSWKDHTNKTRVVDVWAERAYAVSLYQAFGKRIRIFGEESLRDPDLDLSDIDEVVGIVDVVDGTDLLALAISLWCSASIFFIPKQKRILLAIVADAFGRVYFAQERGPAFVTDPDERDNGVNKVLKSKREIRPLAHSTIDEAYISFYGQKQSHLLPVLECKDLLARAHRLYNFAGNPMMVKVADGTMSAVFEIQGQHAHDVAPGAFIAAQAGAYVADLDGRPLQLVSALLRPAAEDTKLSYVISCTPFLGEDLRKCVKAPQPDL